MLFRSIPERLPRARNELGSLVRAQFHALGKVCQPPLNIASPKTRRGSPVAQGWRPVGVRARASTGRMARPGRSLGRLNTLPNPGNKGEFGDIMRRRDIRKGKWRVSSSRPPTCTPYKSTEARPIVIRSRGFINGAPVSDPTGSRHNFVQRQPARFRCRSPRIVSGPR